MAAGFASTAAAQARGSWLLDPVMLHLSAHAKKFSCVKCHEDIVRSKLHPDPRNVNRKASKASAEEKCRKCHVPVYEKLKQNEHGRMREVKAIRFQNCLTCHNPHANLKVEYLRTSRITFDKSLRSQCGACHQARQTLPKRSAEDEKCLACHAYEANDPGSRDRLITFCFSCHGNKATPTQKLAARDAVFIDEAAYKSTPHAKQACISCHPAAAGYGHKSQARGNCLLCHSNSGVGAAFPSATGRHAPAAPHYAELKEDPHIGVECRACHAGGGRPVLDARSKLVVWQRTAKPGTVSQAHNMTRAGKSEDCQRCHVQANRVGAAAMVLPAKSVLCIGCHTATLSVAGDTTTVVSLLVFLAGLAIALSYWLSGTLPGREDSGTGAKGVALLGGGLRALASSRLPAILKALAVDGIGQRRLYRQSGLRWSIHSLIFLPFVVRFAWGMAGLISANLWKGATWYQFLLDKNNPATALLFDLTGVLVIIGICAAIARGIARRSERVPGLPRQDYLALGLIGGVVVVGFVLEGMRIAMTGASGMAAFAFFGYFISKAFTNGPALTGAYGYVWYLHAILTGAFVAYLPFSRMFHILMAPVVLAMRAAQPHRHEPAPLAPEHAAGD